METMIYGRGGSDSDSSSSSSTGTEYHDTLSSKSYIKAIDLLGEGEFEQVLLGGLTGFLLDDVPVQNQDGTYNYTGISVETRPGALGQTRMNIGDTTENTESIGTELRYNLPIEYSVTATEADVVRVNVSVPSLLFTNSTTGDITGTSVSYAIAWKDSVSPTWNAVTDGTSQIINTVISSTGQDVTGSSFSGYSYYEYIFNITACQAFVYYNTGNENDSGSGGWMQGTTVYQVQYRVNGGGWTTLSSATFAASLTVSGSLNAAPSDIIDLRIVLSDTYPPPPVFISYTENSHVTGASVNVVYSLASSGFTISGKSSSEYEKQVSFRISGTAPWIIRVTRLTADSTSSYLQNQTYLSSVTTVLEEKLRYPGSVLVGGVYDAEQFSSVPSRAFLCKCLRIKVPTNYDPISRAYSGVWDGSFKVAWTDNPAWCYYDLLTNARYGLGDRIPESYVDKAELYTIAKYCDEMVPGYNSTYEPRFTCNIVLQTKEEAYQVISDFASIFRGMNYWGAGTVVPIQDRPRDPSYAFTNANVVDGVFTYQSSTLATRYNVACVTWNNPANFYKREVEYVEDYDLITSLGYINESSVVAIGCTSRGMARRVGRWLIYTNNYQTDVVTFTSGTEGVVPRPGDVIYISDTLRSQDRRGGRIASATLLGAVIDSPHAFTEGVIYTFSAIDIDGNLIETTFVATGTTSTITFQTALTKEIAENSIYIVADSNIEPQQFKIVSVTDKGEGQYEINALSHNQTKYNSIEYSIPTIETALPGATIFSVTGIDYNEYLYTDGVSVKNRCDVSWKAPKFAKKYIVNIRQPDGILIKETVTTTDYSILDATAGDWKISITAVNIFGAQSKAFEQSIHLYGKTKVPARVQDLSVVAVGGKAHVSWDTHSDLDVIVGGFISITHSPKTSGAKWEDGILVENVVGGNTSALVPLMGGTYMAKAIDSSGFYSFEASFASADYALLQQKNIVDVLQESPSFVGTKTNMVVVGNSLTLDSTVLIDDAGLIDSYSLFDYLGGGVQTSGEYLFSRAIDMGAVYGVNISCIVSAYKAEVYSLIDGRAELIDDWPEIDIFIANTSSVKTLISTTNDDPDLSPTWSDWAEFKIATYSARAFKFKLVVQTISDAYTVFIDSLSATVDVEDRTYGENDLVCTVSGLNLTFSPAFMLTPAVSISINDMLEGDYYEISNKTREGVSFTIKNSGSAVERVIDYIAKGYGYES